MSSSPRPGRICCPSTWRPTTRPASPTPCVFPRFPKYPLWGQARAGPEGGAPAALPHRIEHAEVAAGAGYINRQAGVELKVTMEAFGLSHKAEILDALRQAGYQVREVPPSGTITG